MKKNLRDQKIYIQFEEEIKNILKEVEKELDNPDTQVYQKGAEKTLQRNYLELLIRMHLFLKEGKIKQEIIIKLALRINDARRKIIYFL
jgi:hypothetical protein